MYDMTAVYIRCALMILLFLLFFYMASFVLEPVLKIKFKDISDRLVCGCFTCFIIFELISVPLILTSRPFHWLVTCWIAVIILWFVVIDSVLFVRFSCGRVSPGELGTASVIMIIIAACAAVFLAVISVCQRYIAWDPGFYIGTMNTTLYTDTMYLFDGADGTPEKYINLRYALSGFYMFFTIFCSLFSIPARTMAWFVMRPLCVLMSALCVYRLGMAIRTSQPVSRRSVIFKDCRAFSALLVVLWAGVSFFWSGLHTTAYFMIVRGYEAKGWCANVVLPMVLCACIVLLYGQRVDKDEWWKRLGLVCFASVPLSMSSMALVPACVAILVFTLLLRYGQVKMTITRAVVCVLPNLMIMALYLASKLEVIKIGVG